MRKVCKGKITDSANERVTASTKQNMREIELKNQSEILHVTKSNI